jgi:ABC-type uncharacterized transport system permease subunit
MWKLFQLAIICGVVYFFKDAPDQGGEAAPVFGLIAAAASTAFVSAVIGFLRARFRKSPQVLR